MFRLLASALLVIFVSTSAHAATVVSFVSIPTAGRVDADQEAAGVTGFDLGRSTGLTPFLGTSSTYNSSNWFLGGDKLSALIANDALFWGFTSTIGYNLTSLDISYDRSPTGPSSIAIDLIIRDAITNTVTSQTQIFEDLNVDESPGVNDFVSIDLTSFDNIQSAFFRLSGWNASNVRGTFDIENRLQGDKGIVVKGVAVAPVPLPAAGWMLLAGLGGLAALRRRKNA